MEMAFATHLKWSDVRTARLATTTLQPLTLVLAFSLPRATTAPDNAFKITMAMGSATFSKLQVARMQRPVTTIQTLRTTMALASNWTFVGFVVAMASQRVHATATATSSTHVESVAAMASLLELVTAMEMSWMLAEFVLATAFLLAPATVQGMSWMPAEFAVDQA